MQARDTSPVHHFLIAIGQLWSCLVASADDMIFFGKLERHRHWLRERFTLAL